MTSVGLLHGTSCHVASILFPPFFAFALAGCGGSSSLIKIANPPVSPADITGNWVLIAGMGTSAGAGRPIAAYLSSNNGAVSGNAVVSGAFPAVCDPSGCCGGPFAQFNGSLSGTVDARGNLILGSAVPNGGPVFSMTATASHGTLSNGSFTLTGIGSCAAQGAMAGTEYPTLAGTYSGTLTSNNTGQSFAISETLNQSSSLNSMGYFDVSATANLSGYSCVTSTTEATPLDMNSGFLGDSFSVTMNTPSGGTLDLSGAISPDGKTVSATYVFALIGGSCNLDIGKGTLALQ